MEEDALTFLAADTHSGSTNLHFQTEQEVNTCQRGELEFAATAGHATITGCFPPGNLTNRIQAASCEPRLLVVTYLRADQYPLKEHLTLEPPRATGELPQTVALVRCRRQGGHMRTTVSHEHPREVTPGISFHGNPEESEKEKRGPAKGL
ncbi:hypothetical protein GH733_006557 [Mirounga leonina]|nr:hypothetical protein GH733_006557 [Mirounga leonina]